LAIPTNVCLSQLDLQNGRSGIGQDLPPTRFRLERTDSFDGAPHRLVIDTHYAVGRPAVSGIRPIHEIYTPLALQFCCIGSGLPNVGHNLDRLDGLERKVLVKIPEFLRCGADPSRGGRLEALPGACQLWFVG
jgi:hypothetical protein